MTCAERLLIDADAGNRGRMLACQPARNGSLEDVPGLIAADADEQAGSLHGLTGLKDVDHERLYEQGESAVRCRPWHLDLHYSVLRALDPRGTGMVKRVEFAGVEMSPQPLRGVVVAGQFPATLRTVPAAAFRALNVDVDLG